MGEGLGQATLTETTWTLKDTDNSMDLDPQERGYFKGLGHSRTPIIQRTLTLKDSDIENDLNTQRHR